MNPPSAPDGAALTISMAEELDGLRLAAASDDAPRVGWFCVHAPVELIAAAGLRPTRLRGLALETPIADAHISPHTCRHLRCTLEDELSHASSVEAIIGVACCDSQKRHFEIWSETADIAFAHLFDMPRLATPAAKAYLIRKIELTKRSIEKAYAVRITKKRLTKAIADFNRVRALLRHLDELRGSSPGVIDSGEFHELVLLSMECPTDAAVETLNLVIEKAKQGHRPTTAPLAVAVTGTVVDDSSPFSAIEKSGGSVVLDDLCTGSRFYGTDAPTSGDVLEAIAERSLTVPPCPRMVRKTGRFSSFVDKASTRGVKAVILLGQEGCDPSRLDYPDLLSEAERRAMPACFIELGSGTGPSPADGIAQFMEMMLDVAMEK